MYSGCLTALATPFTENFKLDIPSYKRLIAAQLRAGVSGFVACGSTGEAATLSDLEYVQIVSLTKELAEGKPVVAGVNSSSTQRAAELAIFAEQAGADALLVVSPPYNKPPQQGLLEHFRAVKKATRIPIIAYNIPGRTAVALAPATLAVLLKEETIVGIKESSGSLDAQLDIFHACGTDCGLLAGDDTFVLGLLAHGARGVISASANVAPKAFSDLCRAWEKGKLEESRAIQLQLVPLIRSLFIETNPIPVKYILARLGIFESPAVRLPLVPLQSENTARLDKVLNELSSLCLARV